MNISTNISHIFLHMIDECFPKGDHPVHKIFNRNTLKLSYYCCMPNMQNIISFDCITNLYWTIKKKLQPKKTASTQKCNCSQKNTCPLFGKCQTEGITHKPQLLEKTTWNKKRMLDYCIYNCKHFYKILKPHQLIRNPKTTCKATELSKHFWTLI